MINIPSLPLRRIRRRLGGGRQNYIPSRRKLPWFVRIIAVGLAGCMAWPGMAVLGLASSVPSHGFEYSTRDPGLWTRDHFNGQALSPRSVLTHGTPATEAAHEVAKNIRGGPLETLSAERERLLNGTGTYTPAPTGLDAEIILNRAGIVLAAQKRVLGHAPLSIWTFLIPGTRLTDAENSSNVSDDDKQLQNATIDESLRIRHSASPYGTEKVTEKFLLEDIEGPAIDLCRKIGRWGGIPCGSNAFGPFGKGVLWKDRNQVFYYTPLTINDYVQWFTQDYSVPLSVTTEIGHVLYPGILREGQAVTITLQTGSHSISRRTPALRLFVARSASNWDAERPGEEMLRGLDLLPIEDRDEVEVLTPFRSNGDGVYTVKLPTLSRGVRRIYFKLQVGEETVGNSSSYRSFVIRVEPVKFQGGAAAPESPIQKAKGRPGLRRALGGGA